MSDSLERPSAAAGWVFNDEKLVFARGASSKNRTRVPASAAFRPHPQPSAAIGARWVGVKRRYGSPPSNSPRLLFVIYKVDVVGVVGCSHTPEESADNAYNATQHK